MVTTTGPVSPPRNPRDPVETRIQGWMEEYADLVEEIVYSSYSEILSHMKDDLPNECVGLLWMDGTIQRLINQARSPDRFSISQPQLAEKLAEQDETNVLVCVYHSHPGGTTSLSPDDKKSIRRQWNNDLVIPWLVVCGKDAELWYILDQDEELFVSRKLTGIGND